ncbi:short-chain fatty acyl-CoA regulator family protein (plasmid) [Cereibacter azotoformans]|uniref:short-chain fatty acyl-CoA regulator family protein n=1 Tax=Cereibacter azotoformans TaxID=43057 RepID=UPI001EEBEA8A|nr:short-chain fatty acyl-CoA regulator family protein [Cereibacter azotoformans]ULB12392.1 short-chain fatty acyl-CoA regulator family protein [Cereibacter azotoformans]
MSKSFMGVRLRRLREERGMTQAALARSLGISPSYLNQIEQNQRPLTVPVLLRLNEAFGLDVQLFSDRDEARLIADLRAALADQGAGASLAEVRELAANMPGIARAIVAMQRRLRETSERADLLAGSLSTPTGASPAAFEAVRDWFYERRNYIPDLDEAAEAIGDALPPGAMNAGLTERLARHGVRLALDTAGESLRRFDPAARLLRVAAHLSAGQQAFQIATQLALLEQGGTIRRLADDPALNCDAQALLRIGLANYFAGALILPYRRFLEAAEAAAYDIERIAHGFGVGFETACHRLSTLQRPEARGVPFFFIRVDRAGNISKRQSATDFHFSRIGGSCPLWNIYEAFARPGEILRQVAQMPDGRSYLWIARTVRHGQGGFGAPVKSFAVAVGCDLTHADRLVYAQGLDLRNPGLATPIGPGCKLCERPACPQRAFPMVARPLAVIEGEARFAPYSGGTN